MLWFCDKGGFGVFLLFIKSKLSIIEYCFGVLILIIMIILIDDLIVIIIYKNCIIKNYCFEVLLNFCGRIGELFDGSVYIFYVWSYILYFWIIV